MIPVNGKGIQPMQKNTIVNIPKMRLRMDWVGLRLSVVCVLSANPREFSRIKAQIRAD